MLIRLFLDEQIGRRERYYCRVLYSQLVLIKAKDSSYLMSQQRSVDNMIVLESFD